MAKSTPTKQRGWLNKSEMADSLGISVQAFDKWGVKPVARIGREVFFTAEAVLENRLNREAEKQQPEGLDGIDPLAEAKLVQERLRHTSAQADAQELKNDVMRRRLVPVEVISFALPRAVAPIASAFDTLPMTIQRRHPDVSPSLLNTIEREAAKIRNECARFGESVPEMLDEYFDLIDEGNIG